MYIYLYLEIRNFRLAEILLCSIPSFVLESCAEEPHALVSKISYLFSQMVDFSPAWKINYILLPSKAGTRHIIDNCEGIAKLRYLNTLLMAHWGQR